MEVQVLVFLLLSFFISSKLWVSSADPGGRFKSIFNFGDSPSDTGNYLAVGAPRFPFIKQLPYGETIFMKATGRSSDGRLIIDFIADYLGLPFLPPYRKLVGGPYVKTGVSFAVFGATALDPDFFYSQNLGPTLWTNDSLSIQVGWFKKWKSSICTTKQECDGYFKTSLFMVGEIGGNDYNIPFLFTRAPIQQVRPFIPFVIQAIVNATTALIEEGAVNLVVPGNLPLGCVPAYLTAYQGANQSTYNPKTGCMDSFNALSKHHNQMLIQALQRLRKRYPQARIAYLDFYGAAIKFYYKPESYGFTRASMLTSCCGGGGPFNFNSTRQCGAPGSTLCEDPSSYVSWDGVHLTEAAYRFMAKGLLL